MVAETLTATETIDLGHGRIEVRRLTASSALGDYLAWPGLQQVFAIERTVTRKRTGQARREIVYGITSLPPQRADANRLLSLVHRHWTIENRSHWVRDVTHDADRSQVRCGSIPQITAALRNLVSVSCTPPAKPISPQPPAVLPPNPGQHSHLSASR